MRSSKTRTCTECGTEFHGREDYLLYGTRWRLSSDHIIWFDCNCGNTLQLPEKEASWFSPSLFMSEQASKVYTSLGAGLKLPKISPQILKLQQGIRNPNTDAAQIAKVLKTDPFMSGRIIQLANNLSPQSTIHTIEHAIGYIGRDLLSDFIMTAFLKKVPFQTQDFAPLHFWEEACLKAHITQRLMKDFGEAVPQDPWLLGSLHDIGKIVGAVVMPQQLDKVVQTMNTPKTQDSWAHIEQSLGIPHYKTLGEIGTVVWGLPSDLKSILTYQPDFQSHPSQICLEAAIMIANEAAYWLRLEPHRVNMQIMEWAFKTLSMDEEQFFKWLQTDPNILELAKEEARQATS